MPPYLIYSFKQGTGANTSTKMIAALHYNTNNEAGIDVAATSGDMVLVGYTETDTFIAKINNSGIYQWDRRIQRSLDNMSPHIAGIDASGNIFIVNTVDSRSTLSVYDSAGNTPVERYLSGLAGTIAPTDSVVDSADNVIISSSYNTPSLSAFVVAKYSGTTNLFIQEVSSVFGLSGGKIITDSNNDIYLLVQENNGASAITFISKLNSSGSEQWRATFNKGASPLFVYSDAEIVVDSSGNIYCGLRDNIIKLNSSGTLIGQVSINQPVSDFYIDSSDNLYLVSNDNSSAYIAQLNTSLIIQWQNKFSSVNKVNIYEITSDGNELVVTGEVLYTGGKIPAKDIMLARIATDGTGTGIYSISSASTYDVTYATTTDIVASVSTDIVPTTAATATWGVSTATDNAGGPNAYSDLDDTALFTKTDI